MNQLFSKIQPLINSSNIKTITIRNHSKATESYVDVEFSYPKHTFTWLGSIPYQYRRLGLFLEQPQDIADLITTAYASLEPEHSKKWVTQEAKTWKKLHDGKQVTKLFFDKLLSLQWNCVRHDFPNNPNWARRVQDIKEMGYMLATNTNKYCELCQRNTTQLVLIPLEKGAQTGYDFISPKLKKRIIKVLGNYDAYEGRVRPSNVLLPDHKFPEISWDETIKDKNLEKLTDDEIKQKFQLMDNQRNLQKREACRKIIQTGNRGEIFGIKYYYEGTQDWPDDIPRIGKEAEKGWIGSPWYDIEAWRRSLNQFIQKNKKK